jgi:hypothetical protein
LLSVVGALTLATSGCAFYLPITGEPARPAVPPDTQVVGEWMVGSGGQSWVDGSGNTQFSSGSGESLTINADGTFTDTTLVNLAPYLDGYFFDDEGAATTNGTTLTLAASQRSGLHREAGESDWQPWQHGAQPGTRSFQWRIDPDGGYLCLTSLDQRNGEVCYGRQR